jgi:hypothetical protein
MRARDLLTGTLGRLVLTALTIAALALVTRGLRALIEREALAVFAETEASAGPSPRLFIQVDSPAHVSDAFSPSAAERARAAFSRTAPTWLCVPASVEPAEAGAAEALRGALEI